MMRRIFAWMILVLFVLLLLNILIFRVYMAESAILYGLMVVLFFFTRLLNRDNAENMPIKGGKEPDEGEEEGESERGTGNKGKEDHNKTGNGKDEQ